MSTFSTAASLGGNLVINLTQQAVEALTDHAQATSTVASSLLSAIVLFEQSLFTAQETDSAAGSLSAGGATLVVSFHNSRFRMGLSQNEQADLVNFLSALSPKPRANSGRHRPRGDCLLRLLLPLFRIALPLGVACLSALLCAQQTTPAVSDEMSDDQLLAGIASSLGPVAINPRQRGFSASILTSSQHDSITDWANVITPQIAYRINRHFSVDAATPIFLYVRTVTSPTIGENSPGLPATATVKHGIAADTVVGAHAYAALNLSRAGRFLTVPTALLVLPSGSVDDGIGTGTVTFNITNHLESLWRFAPYVDLGLGTISRVQNRRLQRDQTARGLLANFALGGRLQLPRSSELSLEAYEQLPLASQHVSTSDPRGDGEPGGNQILVSSSGVAEDNGFNTSYDIPLRRGVILSGFYSRSLRQREDIGGFSFTFLLRRLPRD